MKLTIKEIERMNTLLRTCKKYSGPHVPAGHAKHSYCSTYSDKFIEAAAELWALYRNAGVSLPEKQMSEDFNDRGIENTARTAMSITHTKYLYDNHLKPIVMANLQNRNAS